MKILNFNASKIHGYLDFKIKFNDDITFLTGINGSGKTTVVQSIAALISASIYSLASTKYKVMEVVMNYNGKRVNIKSSKDSQQIIIESSEVNKELIIPLYPEESGGIDYRERERELEFYKEQETINVNHPLIEWVKTLSPPMFLGIERRSRDYILPKERHFILQSPMRRIKNIFGGSLHESLKEAISLAERSFRELGVKEKELTDTLRREIILSAIHFEEASLSPTKIDLRDFKDPDAIKEKIRIAKSTLKKLGLSEPEVSKELGPFLSKSKEISEELPDVVDFKQIEPGKRDDKKFFLIFQVMINKPQLDRMNKILSHAEKYVKESNTIYKPINNYLNNVNKFLQDSNKIIGFDDTGYLNIKTKGDEPIQVKALSSGESQIIVILTHLSFNPAAQAANVFIVDEPELSLHVRWQELFVDALRTVNPNLQLILATHSPSIILDREASCIDLSEGVR